MTDPWDEPETRRWKHHVERDVLPKMKDSSVCISICPSGNKPDIKFAVELGMMIMLDKPIVVVVHPGQEIPPKLELVADKVVHADITTPEGRDLLLEALGDMGVS